MQRTPSAVAVAIATLLGSHAAFAADTAPEFRFSGFATFGVVHSDNDDADFIGTRFAKRCGSTGPMPLPVAT